MTQQKQQDLSLFFEYHDEDDEADDAKAEHYELYEADVDEEYQSDEAVYEVPIQQKFNHFRCENMSSTASLNRRSMQ